MRKEAAQEWRIIMNIYLAGDSIVQNYTDEEVIAGWGQYLPYYVNKDARVINLSLIHTPSPRDRSVSSMPSYA